MYLLFAGAEGFVVAPKLKLVLRDYGTLCLYPTHPIPIRILFLTIPKGLEEKEEKTSQIGGEWKEGEQTRLQTGNKRKIRSDTLTFATIDLDDSVGSGLALHAI